MEITNNEKAGRLEVELDGEVAFAEYRITRGGIVFPHTVVPEAFEGRGIGSALVREGLKLAREKKLKGSRSRAAISASIRSRASAHAGCSSARRRSSDHRLRP